MLGKARSPSCYDDDRARSDISRLLDPSYSNSYYNNPQSVYVDAQGNLHDPDYRHFPLLPQSTQYSHSRRSTNTTRPHWELVHEEASLMEDDEDLLLHEEDHYYSKRNSFGYKSPASSPRDYAASHRSSSPSRGTSIYPRTSVGYRDISPPTSWSSSSSESSSPSSTCSSVLGGRSPFDVATEKSRCRIASSLKSRRRRSAATASVSEKEGKKAKRTSRDFDDEDYLYRQEWPVAEVEEDDERLAEEDDEEERRRSDVEAESVPTCTDALKKRWQGLSLSIQFGMFRAERRIKRRVQSLI